MYTPGLDKCTKEFLPFGKGERESFPTLDRGGTIHMKRKIKDVEIVEGFSIVN